MARPSSLRMGMFCRFGIIAAQTAGLGADLVEAGVDPPGAGVQVLLEVVEIRVLRA